ncbi:serine hydrolase domain-containing protein [Erythrobacter donghaensis]|uniref:serine hydrolase domain-containing protein n=1 Tax=Erythrobacter donghaensis TaxID=267135 RepID=UPI000A373A1E|nr:serine hydrolase domain-containing protein [Erythrobacter donghaensis]
MRGDTARMTWMRAAALMLSCALGVAPSLAAAQDTPPPASVVVAFDRETITPLIVEGLANKDTGRAVEANDPVRIASISKLIMALTALRLVDERKLDLDRDVSNYLGWPVRSPYHPDAPVTLAHLLSHRAGLSDAGGYIVPLGESLEAKFADPAAWRDVGPPGAAAFEYANLGSPLVATVLEKASGERYDRLVERLVFKPLGVKACLNWIGCGPDMEARAVTLYRDTGEVAKDAPAELQPACTIPVAEGVACDLDAYVPGTNASIFSPQGGVRIGMVDLAKIGQGILFNDAFLSDRSSDVLNRVSFEGETEGQEFFCHYWLGFQYINRFPGRCKDGLFDSTDYPELDAVGHSGEAYGLQSGLWLLAGGESGLVYFTTEVPPPAGGEDTGGFTDREKGLIKRAFEQAGRN